MSLWISAVATAKSAPSSTWPYVRGGAYIEGAWAQEVNIYRGSDCHFDIRDDEYDREADRYRPHMTELISGVSGRAYLDARHPRIWIRGSEATDQPNLGYRWLEENEVFPFYELRSAAQDLRRGGLFDAAIARRQIAAQLDTLIEAKIRHAVLGAFGCGAFRNPADEVAAIYRQEIERRQDSFYIIAFAILQMPYQASSIIHFQRAFTGS